jgi:hypothetical protein
MGSNVIQDSSQGADSKLVVVRDGHVMLRRLVASEAQMAAGLPGDAVPESRQGLGELRPGNVPG